jgi:hypothetical protein
VVQQVLGESQCLDNTLNQCLEKCKQLIERLDTFQIRHVSRDENKVANCLAQQATGYAVKRGRFSVVEKPTSCDALDANESAATEAGDAIAGDWRTVIQRCIADPGA